LARSFATTIAGRRALGFQSISPVIGKGYAHKIDSSNLTTYQRYATASAAITTRSDPDTLHESLLKALPNKPRLHLMLATVGCLMFSSALFAAEVKMVSTTYVTKPSSNIRLTSAFSQPNDTLLVSG
jgi:hypothetical protein